MKFFKKNDGLSYWAKIRDAEDDGFIAIAQAWSAVTDRWNEGREGKIAITCMAGVAFFSLVAVGFWLQTYFPTFDPSR